MTAVFPPGGSASNFLWNKAELRWNCGPDTYYLSDSVSVVPSLTPFPNRAPHRVAVKLQGKRCQHPMECLTHSKPSREEV